MCGTHSEGIQGLGSGNSGLADQESDHQHLTSCRFSGCSLPSQALIIESVFRCRPREDFAPPVAFARADWTRRTAPWRPIHLPRHLVAHAGTHTAWLIPVRSNLLQTTCFGMEVPTNPRECVLEVNDMQIDSRSPNSRTIQRHHLKQFDYHPNGPKSFVWKRVGLQRVLHRPQTTEARDWITIDGSISLLTP